jgi:hypothetical protein
MEEDDEEEDGSVGVVALAPTPTAGVGAVGSEEGWVFGGGDCGWEGETRGRSGGTEKGSERADLGRKVVREGEGIVGTAL